MSHDAAKPPPGWKPFKFGNQIPFCEPRVCQGYYSPYYTEKHHAFRRRVREFLEKEILPNREKWIKEGYPLSLHRKAYEAGLQGVIYPKELGGTQPDDYDAFYGLILSDELARDCGGGILGQMAINSMALPPIIRAGTAEMRERVVRPVIQGHKNICLAISEPYAGSDVAGIRTTAVKSADGKHFVVNGTKKWITGGLCADFFTTAVRTDGGISLLLLERGMPGISIRKMETQFDNAHNTTFITLEDVKVPVTNLIGEEDAGFMLLLFNFNAERVTISAGTCRAARMCYQIAFEYAMKRKTFGKTLLQHQVIRAKFAEMAMRIEALQDMLEAVTYQVQCGVPDYKLGGYVAMLKVNASRTFELCAREASQIFGGSAIVREGQGMLIERLYRSVRASAIPGGSEEVLMDFAIRQAATKAAKL